MAEADDTMSLESGRNTEVFDLEDKSFHCTIPNHFPIPLYQSAGGLVNDGETPFICGGIKKLKKDPVLSQRYIKMDGITDCFLMTENGKWEKDDVASLQSLTVVRNTGSAVVHNQIVVGVDFYKPQGMFLASPHNNVTSLKDTFGGNNNCKFCCKCFACLSVDMYVYCHL